MAGGAQLVREEDNALCTPRGVESMWYTQVKEQQLGKQCAQGAAGRGYFW